MGFCKLVSSITESSLWSEEYSTRLLFISMLARADAMGFVEASIPGLARLSNITAPETRAGIARLEAPDQDSKDPENEGRRIAKVDGGWVILNYEKYRNARDPDHRREYLRCYMREWRRKQKPQPVNATPERKQPVNKSVHCKPQAEAEAEAEADKCTNGNSVCVESEFPFGYTNGRADAPQTRKGAKSFFPPTLEQCQAYASKIQLTSEEAEKFFDHFESNGWRVGGKSPMKDFSAAMRNWKRNLPNFAPVNDLTTTTQDKRIRTARPSLAEYRAGF
jgi:hypothetical protein